MKIAIVTDSSAGISKEEALDNGIYVARMPLNIDGKEYFEEQDISRDQLIQAMRRGARVSTSQPPMGALIDMFEMLLETHDYIIFLPISSKLSGTYQTACGIAQEYNNRIHVIDSKFVSCPLYLLSLEVKRMVDRGFEPQLIASLIEKESDMYASLMPEDIVFLKRGGRITPAAAAIANLLKIIPVLKVAHGMIDLDAKVRTFKKAVKTGFEHTTNISAMHEYEWIVLDGDCDEKLIHTVAKDLEKETGQSVIIRPLYPIVMAHTGPGSIAIARRKKLMVD